MKVRVLGVAAACGACASYAAATTSAGSSADHSVLQLWHEPVAVADDASEQSSGDALHGHLDTDADSSARWFQWLIYPSVTSIGTTDVVQAVSWTHDPAVGVSVASLDRFRVEARWNLSRSPLPAGGQDVLWELYAVQGKGEARVVAAGASSAQPFAIESVEEGSLDDESARSGGHTGANADAGGLECEFDAAFCVPELVAIRFPNMTEQPEDTVDGVNASPSLLGVNDSILVEFFQSTNRPNATTMKDIGGIVAFSEYVGDNLTGSWSADGRVLALKVLEIDENKVKPGRELLAGLVNTKAIYKNHLDGASRGPRPNDTLSLVSYSLALSFRIERPGLYFLRVTGIAGGMEASSTPETRAFHSPTFTVQGSDTSHVVLVDASSTSSATTTRHIHHDEHSTTDVHSSVLHSDQDSSVLTPPSLFIPGVLTYGGDEGFIIPESAVQIPGAPRVGSWSLSFWVFLTEDAMGSFRSLFFHGDGTLEQRTPSAWWKPDERRLVLRVSTEADPDVGLDSGRRLPLREWMHLGFSFHNCSSSMDDDADSACPTPGSDAPRWHYAIEFFVNGELDQRVRVHDHVSRNFGPLHIGKGPWTPGMKGFTSDLRVFPSPLPREQHRRQFLLNKNSYPSYHQLDRGESEVRDLQAAAKAPTTQIAYLFHRLMTASKTPSSEEGDEVRQLASQCDEVAWDRLNELAEHGNADALGHVGTSLLYGKWSSIDMEVSDCVPIAQNASEAAHLLLRAFQSGNLNAGRYLALALEIVNTGCQDDEDDPNDLMRALLPFKLGLYHAAAAAGSKAAFAILGSMYRERSDAPVAVAAHHYFQAARDASIAYHERGKQPLHEMDRLYDYLDFEGHEDLSARGQRGEDDELIQFQQMRADQHGDVEAMAAMGDLYYWGSRGVPRDHERAFHYFERAAQAGHANAQCAVANMLLRGEGGVKQDNATAIAWYERAAETENHPRALNGLGFIHFYGSAGVDENKTRALELFERAAGEQRDGDSLFNAGYCHAKGIGTQDGQVNMTRAIELFEAAAHKFGHFDSVMELAEIWMRGVTIRSSNLAVDDGSGESAAASETIDTVDADWTRAVPYVKAAADTGRWGGKMRAGFSLFLARDWQRAIVQYHDANEFGGYPLATSNLAFLYDALLVHDGDVDAATRLLKERGALKFLLRAHEQNGDREVLVRIGDFHFQKLAGLQADPRAAIAWYSRASARGDDRGAYNVGYMYENGIGSVDTNLLRARRYYERAAELAAESNRGQFASIPARLALLRVAAREWVQGSPILEALTSLLGSRDNSRGLSVDGVHLFDRRQHTWHSVSGPAAVTLSTAFAGLLLIELARRHLQFLRPN